MPFHSPMIIHDATPEIVDTALTLIVMMGSGMCHLPFYLLKLPILLVWMDATMQRFDCWTGKTINRWHSIDAHLWAHLRDILTVIGCSTIVHTMHTVCFASQYTVSMYYHLNSESSTHLSFWATTIHIICMMNDVSPSCIGAFGRQFTAWISMH